VFKLSAVSTLTSSSTYATLELASQPHIDFAGPVAGKMILVVVDARSKWIETYPMATATASTTIQQLRLFAKFGIPQSIVSDNSPQSAEVCSIGSLYILYNFIIL